MQASDAPEVWTWSEEPLLGTRVSVRIAGHDAERAGELADRIFARCEQLEGVFSVFDESSALRRWCRGELDDAALPPELVGVLAAADAWQRRSGGVFTMQAAPLMALWRAAERDGVEPAQAAVDEALAFLRRPPYRVRAAMVRRTHTPCTVDLNAIAKGAIVDLAVAEWDRTAGATGGDGVVSLLVNAGGDLLHRGTGAVRVGIEDPQRPYDNAPPLTAVDLADAALATSGPTRRGFRVAGRWYGHVLDPRSGRPTDGVLSASVVASDAVTADAVATVVAVLEPAEAICFVDGLAVAPAPDRVVGVACLVVDRAGRVWRSTGWADAPLS